MAPDNGEGNGDTFVKDRLAAEVFYDEVLATLQEFPAGVLTPDLGLAGVEAMRSRLLNYASRVRQLDLVLEQLGTKRFCQSQCDRWPIGCCWEYVHRMANEDFQELLELQEVEARRNGWTRPSSNSSRSTRTSASPTCAK